MKAQLIAHTTLTKEINNTHQQYEPNHNYPDPENLTEFAGRSCYQSWNKPNPETAKPDGYINNILKQQHYSVLEHATATFYITNITRALTHELIRHRHFSFSQQSQRFVDETNAQLIPPPAIKNHWNQKTPNGQTISQIWQQHTHQTKTTYETLYNTLTQQGLPHKQAREAARSILPNATETRIVVTGNHRTWREFIQKRATNHADQEIRQLAHEILKQLHNHAPNIYQDLYNQAQP